MAKKRKLQQKIQQSDSPLLKSLRDAGSQEEARSILYEAIKNAHKNFEVNRQIISDRESFIKEKQRENLQNLKYSQSPRQTDLFRQEALNKFNQFREVSSPAHRDQYVKSQQNLAQADFRNQLRQTEIIRDPQQRVERLNQIIQGASSQGVSSGNRFVVDAIKKRDQITESIQKQQRLQYLAEKDRGPLRDLLSSEEYQNPQRRPGLTQAEQRKNMLTDLQASTHSKDVLTEIRDELKKQTGLQVREKQDEKVKKAEERDTENLKKERFDRIGAVGGALAGSALAAGGLYSGIERRLIEAERGSFGAVSAVQNQQQKVFMNSMLDYSGEGIVRRYGDLLFGAGRQDSQYLGESGYKQALSDSVDIAERERSLQKTGASLGVLSTIASTIGATFLGSKLGPIGAVGAGVSAFSSSTERLLDNKVLQENLGSQAMKDRSYAERLLDAQKQTEAFRDQAVARNLISTEGVQGAIDLRLSEANLLRMGGSLVSSREAIGRIGRQSLSPNQTSEEYQQSIANIRNQIANRQAPGLEFITDYALSAQEYDMKTAQAEFAMGAGKRDVGRKRQVANRLLDLEQSGRGSFDQLLGNVSSINRLSGAGDSDQKLRKIMSEAVSIGFDNAKLAQDFTQTVTSLAAQTRAGSTDVLSSNLGTLTSMFGGSQRALGAAADFYGKIDAFRTENNLGAAGAGMGTVDAIHNLMKSGMDAGQANTIANLMAEMNTTQRDEFFEQVRTGNYSEQNALIGAAIGKNPELAESFKMAELNARTGMQGKQIRDFALSLDPNMSRDEILQAITKNPYTQKMLNMKGHTAETVMGIVAQQNPALAKPLSPRASAEDRERQQRIRTAEATKINILTGRTAVDAGGEASLSQTFFEDMLAADSTGSLASSMALRTLDAGGSIGSGLGGAKERQFLEDSGFQERLRMFGRGITKDMKYEDYLQSSAVRSMMMMPEGEKTGALTREEFDLTKALKQKDAFTNILEEDKRRVDAMQSMGISTVEIARTSIIELAKSIAEQHKLKNPDNLGSTSRMKGRFSD